MEPGGSSLHSLQPAASPYPKPDQSSPNPHTSLRSILILSSHLSPNSVKCGKPI